MAGCGLRTRTVAGEDTGGRRGSEVQAHPVGWNFSANHAAFPGDNRCRTIQRKSHRVIPSRSIVEELLGYTALFGPGFLAAQGLADDAASANADPGKRYDMRTSINLWAFPYPQPMTLIECFQLARDAGFDAVEVNYNLEGGHLARRERGGP